MSNREIRTSRLSAQTSYRISGKSRSSTKSPMNDYSTMQVLSGHLSTSTSSSQRCPHCQNPIYGVSETLSTTPAYDYHARLGQARKLRSRESDPSQRQALHRTSCVDVHDPSVTTFSQAKARCKTSALWPRPSRLFSFIARNNKKEDSSTNPVVMPRRPTRPHADQCPPNRDVMYGDTKNAMSPWPQPLQPQKTSRASASALASVEQGKPHSRSVFPNPESMEDSTLTISAHKYPPLSTQRKASQVDVEPQLQGAKYQFRADPFVYDDANAEDTQSLGFWYNSPQSFSTLPTTASKAALQPSPLRPIKEERTAHKAPTNLQSHPGTKTNGTAKTPTPRGTFHDPSDAQTQQFSIYSSSAYSSDSVAETNSSPNTPSTSPPPIPERSLSRRLPYQQSPSVQAEDLREELGIVDDVYEMFAADSTKKSRHEGLVFDLAAGTVPITPVKSSTQEKESRTQRRLAKERAYRETERMLTGANSDPVAQLGVALAGSTRDVVHGKPNRHSYDPALLEWPDRQTSASAKAAAIAAPEVGDRQQDDSLSELRKKLLELTKIDDEDDSSSTRHSTTPQGPSTPSSLSKSSQHSTPPSSIDDEGSRLGLQRIEIEWKGRRYPVLIGPKAEVFEGPCLDKSCLEHDMRRFDLSEDWF